VTEAGQPLPVVAVDTGGTFTDLLMVADGRLHRLKLPSTPHDPAEAVLAGLERLVEPGQAYVLIHGSTVATNALLERKGARVGLVTNRGFEDVLAIGRQNRPQLYALVGHRPAPLVSERYRIGISGRLDELGSELEPLSTQELGALGQRLEGVEAIAVVLLHSYANPEHERAVVAALSDVGVPISASVDVLPEYREFERTSTTVVNAFVQPCMSAYLGRIERESGAERFHVMGSGGGILPVQRARTQPVHTTLSGPAGGVVAALDWGRRSGQDRLISFDMGGTSTDVALCPGRLLHTREFSIAGSPVAIPVLDIHTVGAGGGSIARIDAGGALHVGPESAGADPGPIAYGLGGDAVTVTDAHVWLGRLPAGGFLGGERSLDRPAIEPPLKALAERMGTSVEHACEGVLAVAEVAMVRALRVISVERGFDPAEFTLVAFGGAGGLHAASLAASLGAARALVPPDPGLLSAYGMLAAPLRHVVSRTLLATGDETDVDARIEAAFRALDLAATTSLQRETGADAPPAVYRSLDVRYRGQSYEMQVPLENWRAAFHDAHRVRYGYARLESAVEVVTARSTAELPGVDVALPGLPEAEGGPPTHDVSVWLDGSYRNVPATWRHDLAAGHEITGPSVIMGYSGTVWIPSAWVAQVGGHGEVHLLPGP